MKVLFIGAYGKSRSAFRRATEESSTDQGKSLDPKS